MLLELFSELRRVTQLLGAAGTSEVSRAHLATVQALVALTEDVATQAQVPLAVPVNLETLLGEIIEQLAPLLEERAVKISLERHSLKGPVVSADPERARQLMLWLITILLEQSLPGDTLTVSFRGAGGQLGVSLAVTALRGDARLSLAGALATRLSWRLFDRAGGEPRVDLFFPAAPADGLGVAGRSLDDEVRFDERRLPGLMGGLSPEGVRRLRGSFLEVAQRLAAGLRTGEGEEDGVLAHSLRGAAAMVGADVLAQLCASFENALVENRGAELDALSTAIRSEVRWLMERLARESAGGVPPEGQVLPVVSLNVLVLDDDAFVRASLAVMLGHLTSKSVTQCASAEEAFEALPRFAEAEPLDVIICDLRMPQTDGVTFIRQLAEARYRGAVVIVSVADLRLRQSVERLARSLGLQVVASLAKPTSSAQLGAALVRVQDGLGKRRPRPITARVIKAPRWSAADLRAAIADGGVRPYYQPKVSLRTGRITGVEALSRWVHPEFGVISPAGFLPLATREGLMDELLLSSIERVTELLSAAPHLTVAVNLEASTVCNEGALKRMVDLVHARHIAPERLVLELTETEMQGDPRHVAELLARLQLQGFKLAIDDFGTGRSTHERVADIPFSELKIDRQFVREGGREEAARAVVDTSVTLARRLKMTTTAEGVETAEELEFVRRAGCDGIQGYLVSQPLPFGEFMTFLAGFHPLRTTPL